MKLCIAPERVLRFFIVAALVAAFTHSILVGILTFCVLKIRAQYKIDHGHFEGTSINI